eukprot:GILI01054342.1.p1 GENE.GILI01054342.1~~GILI01054342.1.p1  ORF type:complete len:153 (+),score=28.57 GILI01054342.1:50-508(+)
MSSKVTNVADPTAPCKTESVMWRECLKTYDYGPEKPEKECEKERGRYYSCIRDWRTNQGLKYEAGKEFVLPTTCSGFAQNLHNCMMINMFEMQKCTSEMAKLRVCVAKFDPEVARNLEEDVKQGYVVLPSSDTSIEASTGIRRIWNKIIGKL